MPTPAPCATLRVSPWRSWKGRFLWLAAAMVSFLSTGNALDMAEYDRMAATEQVEYADHLIQSVTEWLVQNNRSSDAETVARFFARPSGANPDGAGLRRWKANLQVVREMNVGRTVGQKPAYTVEHAFSLTLKEAEVRVSLQEILAMGQRFRPAPRFRSSKAESLQIH